ncbi:helix-turn-helix domain-containing protein [Halochromatium sp.]
MNDGQSFAVTDVEKHESGHTEPLRECVLTALRSYLCSMGDHDIRGLYRLVMDEVEQPMFTAVLEHTKGNQSAAAEILGISRGTLRKKLKPRTDQA